MKRIVSSLLAVLFLCFALAGCGSNQSSPDAVVGKFVQAINNNDLEGMISCMVPDVQDSVKSILAMYGTSSASDLSEMMGYESGTKFTLKITNVVVDGDTATVSTELTGSDGSSETSDVPCVKVDGKWYLDIGY
ncbi:hypothetical protein SDC9_134199 [bioreactor metagenome]|uniref:DUF4878 domain-containing protein n=1 Tax=bioreactor metagenome TaxID=1076179 RepID=A0A645DCL4_9ZZZZ